ncbi:MAG: polysaccharide biosynthesis/export family protein [Bacteroidetes bacterium]|nr:polysaccharide biosynthesis/export family protein [Bacteroidota bacterium]MBU1580299.1 polysaccharide biosynthesis/export family protein [Bacteroidota bacterium]MBU2466965.1 polysaccharide biosynthesis/export family protein [Bacteroidota bacterium]MBU2557415.1 polysaccharide biosynthesis/export family protein [Bacteroidota bacterium]
MKKSLRITFRILFMAFIATAVLSSCVPQKKMLYMQMAEQTEVKPSYENERAISYRIQPGDNLYIKVVSLDEKTSMMFNVTGTGNSQQFTNDASVYLNSYTVSEQGTIEFPLAGQVYVQNLNVEQIKERIQEILDEYLKETVLIVKLVNFNLTVLGEVRRPGQYKVYQSEINVFEALSMSGDLTEFAKRSDIKIIRQTKTGSEVITIDMERADILSSDYYYLKPNDIIYVEPLKIKQYGFATFPYALVFSSISTALLLINFFN